MAYGVMAGPPVVKEPEDSEIVGVATDGQTLGRFLSLTGDDAEAAFASIVDRHGAMVLRVCLDVIGDREEARDATQAVFLILASRARSIRKPEALSPWLHGVALRVARRAQVEGIRRRFAERRKAEGMQNRQSHWPDNDAILRFGELHEEVDRLPENYRSPLILCYLQGMTQAEAAKALGWPLGTLQIRLHRGRERLRSRLTRRGIGLGAPLIFPVLAATDLSVGREWTETTAAAAIRFAAGKNMAGLVSSDVMRLAESALPTMFYLHVKTIVSLVLAFLLFAAILQSTSPRPGPGLSEPQAAMPPLAAESSTHPNSAFQTGRQSNRGATKAAELASNTLPEDIHPEVSQTKVESVEPVRPSGRYLAMNPAHLPMNREQVRGSELFERDWIKDDARSHGGDGLGPVFNGTSCVACHFQGGTGGAGGIDQNIEIATFHDQSSQSSGFFYSFSMDLGAGQFQYQMGNTAGRPSRFGPGFDPVTLSAIHPGFRQGRSVVLHRYGADPAYNHWRGTVPGQHGAIQVRISQRNPTPLFGVGLIDAIPDEAIEAIARKKLPSSTGIKGRVSRLKDGRIGRFGWKAQTASLKEFVMSAASGEMGLELPEQHQAGDPRFPGRGANGLDMDANECVALIAFVRELPAPGSIRPVDDHETVQIKAGADIFKSIGCGHCHTPNLGGVEGIYSDLLLHDMSPLLEDVGSYNVFVENQPNAGNEAGDPSSVGAASFREWRTPPLWGLRDSGPYLHDGRAPSIEQAITLHAGQGATSARRYADLSPRRKRQLNAFLRSLAAPALQR